MKLNQDEKESLAEILAHPGSGVLTKVLEALAHDIELSVLRYKADEEKKLILSRAEAEGARKLLTLFTQKVQSLKAKQDV